MLVCPPQPPPPLLHPPPIPKPLPAPLAPRRPRPGYRGAGRGLGRSARRSPFLRFIPLNLRYRSGTLHYSTETTPGRLHSRHHAPPPVFAHSDRLPRWKHAARFTPGQAPLRTGLQALARPVLRVYECLALRSPGSDSGSAKRISLRNPARLPASQAGCIVVIIDSVPSPADPGKRQVTGRFISRATRYLTRGQAGFPPVSQPDHSPRRTALQSCQTGLL